MDKQTLHCRVRTKRHRYDSVDENGRNEGADRLLFGQTLHDLLGSDDDVPRRLGQDHSFYRVTTRHISLTIRIDIVGQRSRFAGRPLSARPAERMPALISAGEVFHKPGLY